MPAALEIIEVITPSVLSLPVLLLALPPKPPPPPLPGIRAITVKTVTPRRAFILLTLVLLAATCAWEAVVLIADILTARYRSGPGHAHLHSAWFVAAGAVHALGGLCIYALSALFAEYRARWGDKALVLLATVAFGLEVPNLVLSVIREVHSDPWDRVFAILNIPPSCLRLILLPVLIVLVLNPIVRFQPADERTGLLADTDADAEVNSVADVTDVADGSRGRNLAPPGYGTFNRSRDTSTATDATPSAPLAGPSDETAATDAAGKKKIVIPKKLGEKKEETQGISWKAFSARLWKLWPHLWPSTSWKLQLCCVLCVLCILIGRGVNVLVPQTLGVFLRTLGLNAHGRAGPSPWPPLLVYIVLRGMQSGGVITFMQGYLWIPVQQYADREMQLLCFNHLLDLSLVFHTKRNTGEVLRIIDRGSAINNLFQILLFNATPTILDILIYSVVFLTYYGPLLSGVMVLTMAAYVTFSIVFTGYRTKLRREMVERDVKTRGIASDVLTNWESVKYFTAEARESRRFKDAILAYQVTESRVTISFTLLNLGQNFLITFGLLLGSIIISYQIMYGPWNLEGEPDAASYVVFLTYLTQLYQPLDRLGTLYRQLNANSTDAEKLFNLLAQPTEIRDSPDAKDLVVTDGVIEFDNVWFSYDKQIQALKGVSFKIGKGESMALVGESGSGKSTILRLLYRFYDIDSGTIRIDGQDISKVTQSSLRRAIGIVPQDSVLWNDTIGANISYGKEGATDEEIIAAAQAARLHDRILSFPEGYSTVVGERGVRLSGGEKQRVSLARMFLKSPTILVLDEATSALDTETERGIQKGLAELAKGRSSLSIAHRLSTIINSDQIVVMKDGNVLEHGSYQELIDLGGQFSTMWRKQILTEAEMVPGAEASTPSSSLAPFPLEPTEGDTQSAAPYLLAPTPDQQVIERASPPSTVAENDDEGEEGDETTGALAKAEAKIENAALEDTPVTRKVELASSPQQASESRETKAMGLDLHPVKLEAGKPASSGPSGSAPPPASYAAVAAARPVSNAEVSVPATSTEHVSAVAAVPDIPEAVSTPAPPLKTVQQALTPEKAKEPPPTLPTPSAKTATPAATPAPAPAPKTAASPPPSSPAAKASASSPPPSSAFPGAPSQPATPILDRPEALRRPESPTKRVVAFPSDLIRPPQRRDSTKSSITGGGDVDSAASANEGGNGTGTSTPPPEDKRRKRLSSIKAFARRISSDQIAQAVPMVRSHSSNSEGGSGSGTDRSHKKRMSFEDKRKRRSSFQGM